MAGEAAPFFQPEGRLALARMPFLSAREKILLDDVLDGRFDAVRLGRAAVEDIVGRRLKDAPWEPEAWLDAARRDKAFLGSRGGSALSWFDEGYPAILRETARAPYMLYLRGALPEMGGAAVAVVGTRFPTGRGLEAASRLARQASAAGVAVVSGLARGIDAAAHRGALAGGSPTCAVLGCGIDTVYPKSNRELAAAIVSAGGCLVSEYPPGTAPTRWSFPERNRIIAGLCRSTIVVEAPEGSGALITSAFALEEGRDVYVARDCEGGSRSAGSDALAADGAMLVSSFAEIAVDWSGRDYTEARERWPAYRAVSRRACEAVER
jgi:DNA processing protein